MPAVHPRQRCQAYLVVWDESEDAVVQHLNACDQRLPIIAKYSSYYLDWFDNAKHVSIFPPELLNIDNPFDMDGFGKPPPCRFLLSSRHLMLASSIFNKKLSGPWKESLKDPVERVRHIETTEWDVDALLILFQIIHGKHSHVPRFVDLEMLAKIATLVDYYDCHEAVQLYGDMWIDGIKNDLPTQCNRELVLWILVSWVFSKENIFNQVTRTAILESKGPVPTLELPIPQFLIDTIETQRIQLIRPVAAQLQNLLDSLRNGTVGCNYECSAILLGHLTKQMYSHDLLELLSDHTCIGYGISDTRTALRTFRSPRWPKYNISGATCASHPCRLVDEILTGACSSFDEKHEGLRLDDVQP
ncbi:hypothetical protein CGCSCA2_v001596 [Colletotrichum siamense]|uniref:BTB domain-containing protein n=1 Tax=Colletotrichum siamense TaxID=690259 RepID=A0A9P5KAZ0_COLSI|nr:hypothetical protein CGCSCA2_v001596 [Colletotrichum siamense]